MEEVGLITSLRDKSQ